MKQSVTPTETMYFTLGQAAKKTGISKATISRDIKKGKLSAERKEDGSYKIQVAELIRVYQPETPELEPETVTMKQSVTPEETLKIKGLEIELKAALEKIGDLEKERDRWHTQAERLTLMLTDQRETHKKKSWWPWSK